MITVPFRVPTWRQKANACTYSSMNWFLPITVKCTTHGPLGPIVVAIANSGARALASSLQSAAAASSKISDAAPRHEADATGVVAYFVI